ncbi:MAG TPA: cytochrome c [Acetobacteraceae bacterium]|nr:cytochrome c [Acetobacteraceae bacterium]
MNALLHQSGLRRMCAAWAFAAGCWLAVPGVAAAQPKPDAALIARGHYLVIAGDCQACHTIDPSKPMAGGYAVPTPFGTIYSSNITPDRTTGIGTWSDSDFVRAMQRGVGKSGKNLYPAFPYDSYTLLSRPDILAMKAYLFSLPPVHNVIPADRLGFPFNQRWILWGWKLLNFRNARFRPDPGKSAAWNRGAYLVNALEHCGTCHTPRNLTMGLETGRSLAGGAVGSWFAYNITPSKAGGIGGWSSRDIVGYLSTGIAPGKAWAAGPMAEAVQHSLSHLHAADLRAIVTYLRSLRPISGGDGKKPRFAHGTPAVYEAVLRGRSGVTASTAAASGAELYSGNCASCHGVTGTGSKGGYFPPLIHDTTVGASRANNLVMVILSGVQRRTPHSDVFMPAFAALDNGQIARLATYMERQFGNPAVHVTAGQVASLRTGKGPGPPYAAIGIAILACVILLAIGIVLLRRARHRHSAQPHPSV